MSPRSLRTASPTWDKVVFSNISHRGISCVDNIFCQPQTLGPVNYLLLVGDRRQGDCIWAAQVSPQPWMSEPKSFFSQLSLRQKTLAVGYFVRWACKNYFRTKRKCHLVPATAGVWKIVNQSVFEITQMPLHYRNSVQVFR